MLIKYTADPRRAVYLLEEFVGEKKEEKKKNKTPSIEATIKMISALPATLLNPKPNAARQPLVPLSFPVHTGHLTRFIHCGHVRRSSTRAAGPRLLPSPGTGVLTPVRCWGSFEFLSLHLKRIKLPIWPTTINLWLPIWENFFSM